MARASNPNDPDQSFEVPPYLEGLYMVWSMVGPAGLTLLTAHEYADYVSAQEHELEDGTIKPPDTVMNAWLDSHVELPDDWSETDPDAMVPLEHDGQPITNYDMIVIAINALASLSHSLKGRLADFDGLPDWLAPEEEDEE